METRMDAAYKFGCGRYVQEPGALERVGPECGRLARKVLIVAGRTARCPTEEAIEGSLRAAGVTGLWQEHAGACSEESAPRLRGRCAGRGVRSGRGRRRRAALDLAKLTARLSGLPVNLRAYVERDVRGVLAALRRLYARGKDARHLAVPAGSERGARGHGHSLCAAAAASWRPACWTRWRSGSR